MSNSTGSVPCGFSYCFGDPLFRRPLDPGDTERLLAEAKWLEQTGEARRRVAAAGTALTMFAKMLSNPIRNNLAAAAVFARAEAEADAALDQLAQIEEASQRAIAEVRSQLLSIQRKQGVSSANPKQGGNSGAAPAIPNVPANPFDRLLSGSPRTSSPH
jgi:hypothetical protein